MAMSKATAIRQVAKDFDVSRTNAEIAEEVERRYGILVGGNQIIEILGCHNDRKHKGNAYQTGIQLALDYLAKFADAKEAIRFLHLAKEGPNA